ncbi:MAG: anti-sigma F factor antagonist [Lachnospiraceae bacterium]|nr:anti-sigma F factor antagonist [Lachnospiraceae bacterium]
MVVKDETLIVYLKEDLDHHNAEKIREKIDDVIEFENTRNIVFDFTNVSFMDSSGIGVIMGRYKKIYYMRGEIAVVGINSIIDKIFTMSGLYRIATKYDSISEAIKDFEECQN